MRNKTKNPCISTDFFVALVYVSAFKKYWLLLGGDLFLNEISSRCDLVYYKLQQARSK